MGEGNQFKASFDQVIEASRSKSASHLEPEELTGYYAGNLPEEESRIQDHLAECPECSQLLLDLAGFSEASKDKSSTDDPEISRQWDAFKSAVGGSTSVVTPPTDVVDIASRRRNRVSPITVGLAIAATVILAVIVVGVWLSMRRAPGPQVARETETARPEVLPSQPQTTPGTSLSPSSSEAPPPRLAQASPDQTKVPNTTPSTSPRELVARNFAVELYPDEALRGEPEVKTIKLPSGVKGLSLTLHIANAPTSASYVAVLRNQRGDVVSSVKAILNQEAKTFHVDFPADKLSDGKYRVALNSTEKGITTTIAEYSIQLQNLER